MASASLPSLCYSSGVVSSDMASSLRVSVLLLAVLVLGLAMTPMASKSSKKWLRLMGKLEKGDIFNEEIQKAVEFAMQEHNKDSTDQNLFRVTRVVRVQEQVRGHWRTAREARSSCTFCHSLHSAPCPTLPSAYPGGLQALSRAGISPGWIPMKSLGSLQALVGVTLTPAHEAWPRPW